MAATTFVTCMFQYDESLLDIWIQSGLHVVLYCTQLDYVRVKEASSTTIIQVKELPDISELEWYHHQNHNLPSVRNEEKDTMEHLWKMQMKVYCVYQAALLLSSETTFFAYIDFDITRMFKHPAETMTSIKENYSMPHLFVSNPNKMYFPGCWGKLLDNVQINAGFANKINWRFCGSFFFGCRDAILQFYHYHTMYFPDFMESVGNTMTWEVNFWAYLEWKVDDWKPVWYAANHDDSIVKIPGLFGYKILLTDYPPDKTTIKVYDYPDMSPFRPMSAAYVEYLGKSYLNTRYVNYWIYDNGGYYYPEDEGVIRTLNVCSVLEAEPLDYQPMNNSPPADLKYDDDDDEDHRPNTFFSKGIEDIRLYVSQETGELCFIGSTLNYSQKKDKIRTIRGVYDVMTHSCRDFQQLDPPTETWCEKNWAPIPLSGGGDGFIYKWFPLEIGKVCSGGKLEIVVRKEMDGRFRHMKGSTVFTFFGDDDHKKLLIGVVHFSEEMHPRQYYHRVVVLDAETFVVVKCSDIFCFEKASVEFCIGCRVIGDRMGFWVSRMDRDPMYMETEMKCIM